MSRATPRSHRREGIRVCLVGLGRIPGTAQSRPAGYHELNGAAMRRRTSELLLIASVCASIALPAGTTRAADTGPPAPTVDRADHIGLSNSTLREEAETVTAGQALPDTEPGMLRVEIHSALPTA